MSTHVTHRVLHISPPIGEHKPQAVAVTIVGYGSDKNKWSGFSEVQVCAYVPEDVFSIKETSSITPTFEHFPPGVEELVRELPFPEGRRGFNVVNMCVVHIRDCVAWLDSCVFKRGRG